MNQEPYLRAVDHFNRAEFFDAHEVWEDIWRESLPPEKQFLQGLIQVAVALHHHSTGNIVGAKSLLPRACKNLAGYPEDYCGIKLGELLQSLEEWKLALAEGTIVPSLPQVKLERKG